MTPEVGCVPVPVSGTVWGELGSLSETDSVADSADWVVGVNVTLMVQLPPLAARVGGETGHVLVWAKSPAFVPVIEMELMVRAEVPSLVSVTVCAALVVFSG